MKPKKKETLIDHTPPRYDHKKIGFKCGLEIHQQLDTLKLFCNCPSLVRDPSTKINTITRRLRPVIGETGEVDSAAAYESTKSKLFIYEFRDTSCCLVELDEEPPHTMNFQALETALQVAHVLHARIVDEVQVMRKIVVDGSNVTGFQRTALIALNGYIETSKGKVGIPSICLEEESSQKVEDHEHFVRYRLDRLGIPLIEIATDASIQDPHHAEECAEKLGLILRSTNKVKRGIGSIRQDVNVSVKGGSRVEIKGFQELKAIPRVIDYEIARQLDLISHGKAVPAQVRKAEEDFTTSFMRPMPGSARLYPETDVVPVLITADIKKAIVVMDLIEDVAKKIFSTYKLPEEVALSLAKQAKSAVFEQACASHPLLKPSFIAEILLSTQKNVKKEYGKNINPTDKDYLDLFLHLDQETIAKESVLALLAEGKPVNEVVSKYSLMSDAQLETELKKIIAQHKDAPFNALIGKAMATLRGKAAGKKITELLEKLLR